MKLAIIVGQIRSVRHYVKFAESVRHIVSMVFAILVGYNLKIICY